MNRILTEAGSCAALALASEVSPHVLEAQTTQTSSGAFLDCMNPM